MAKYADLLVKDNKQIEESLVSHKVSQAKNQAEAAILSKKEQLATAEIEKVRASARYPFNMNAVIAAQDTVDSLKRDIALAEATVAELFG